MEVKVPGGWHFSFQTYSNTELCCIIEGLNTHTLYTLWRTQNPQSYCANMLSDAFSWYRRTIEGNKELQQTANDINRRHQQDVWRCVAVHVDLEWRLLVSVVGASENVFACSGVAWCSKYYISEQLQQAKFWPLDSLETSNPNTKTCIYIGSLKTSAVCTLWNFSFCPKKIEFDHPVSATTWQHLLIKFTRSVVA